MEESVEDRGGDRRVLEDLASLGGPSVRRQADRALLVAAADDLKEVRGSLARQRQVAELVDDQDPGPAQNLIVFCQRPSAAAFEVRTTRSAAVV